MRPLFFDEPNNRDLLTKVSSYLWGNDFLITPILTSEAKEIEVYFPKNNTWFDFYTDEKFEGGTTSLVKVHEHYIPTFVRAGAFIPMAKPMQTTNDYNANTIEVHYYFDASVKQSKSQLYNDDGETTNAFEKGEYELFQFESEIKKRWLEIEFETEIGRNYSPENKQIEFTVHNIDKQPKRIKVDGKKVLVSWNSKSKTLSIPTNWNTKEALEIKIKLKK